MQEQQAKAFVISLPRAKGSALNYVVTLHAERGRAKSWALDYIRRNLGIHCAYTDLRCRQSGYWRDYVRRNHVPLITGLILRWSVDVDGAEVVGGFQLDTLPPT